MQDWSTSFTIVVQYHNELKCPKLSTLSVANVGVGRLCTLPVLVDAEDPCLVYLDGFQTLI